MTVHLIPALTHSSVQKSGSMLNHVSFECLEESLFRSRQYFTQFVIFSCVSETFSLTELTATTAIPVALLAMSFGVEVHPRINIRSKLTTRNNQIFMYILSSYNYKKLCGDINGNT